MRGNNTSKSEENWREHANMQIIFEVGGEEILGPKSILMEKSEYLSDLLSEVSIARVEQVITLSINNIGRRSEFYSPNGQLRAPFSYFSDTYKTYLWEY